MIFTDRTITVRKGESRIDEPIVVYRGDYELEVRFTILNSRFKFMSGTNMIESEKASYGQLAILTPYGGNIFSDIVRCNDGSVTFVLTAEMLNQIEEVGLYSFQIRLMDYNKESRVSIPPIEFGIEVREPIASEDHDNSVNNAIVGYSIAKVVDPKEENVGNTFDESGNYNKTKWETGDRISEGKLNKIEDAIDKVNRNEMGNNSTLSKRIDNNFNVLDATKADKNEVFSMANMGQDVKEAMTGGSVAVVGENAVLEGNIVDSAVTSSKIADGSVMSRHIGMHTYIPVSDLAPVYAKGVYFKGGEEITLADWNVIGPIPIDSEFDIITSISSPPESIFFPGIFTDIGFNFTEDILRGELLERNGDRYTYKYAKPLFNTSAYMFLNLGPVIYSCDKYSEGVIENGHIKNKTLTVDKLSPDFVLNGDKIANGAINDDHIAKDATKSIFNSITYYKLDYYRENTGKYVAMPKCNVTNPIKMKKDDKLIVDISVSNDFIMGVICNSDGEYLRGITYDIEIVTETHHKLTFNAYNDMFVMLNVIPEIMDISIYTMGCLTEVSLRDGCITNSKLSDDFVISNMHILDSSIDGSKIASKGSEVTLKADIEVADKYVDHNGVYKSLVDWGVTTPIRVEGDSLIVMSSNYEPAVVGCLYDADLNPLKIQIPFTYIQPDDNTWTTTLDCSHPSASYVRVNISKTHDRFLIKRLGSGSISSDQLQDGCVTIDKIAPEVLQNVVTGKNYVDLYSTRNAISEFLMKWNAKESLNVVCVGDSITNFQNSQTLSEELQQTAPLGLLGNSWVRRLWRILNYDVYADDRSIVTENGNLGYKRFDHTDFTFAGGYTYGNTLGYAKWGTNRSTATESWRRKYFGSYPQTISILSDCNKMMVGTITPGEYCTVTVPENVIGGSIIFGNSIGEVTVQISDADTVVHEENIQLNDQAYEFHHNLSFTGDGTKTITITLVSGTVWLYGVEYWTDNCVRVVNCGLAGQTVMNMKSKFDLLFQCFNGSKENVDLVVWEVNALNDARELLSTVTSNAKMIFDKFKEMNVPVLVIIPHRDAEAQDSLQYDRFNPIYGTTLPEGSKLVGNKCFYPDYVKMYKTLAYKYNCGLIDIFSKSIDICGTLERYATFPAGFFTDGIHLGIVGNDCYEEELRKVFMWDDYE